MPELKVHASACNDERMVQDIDFERREFVKRLKHAASAAGFDDWGLGARLAEITKVTPKAASKWLKCESMPGRTKMKAIAAALSVRVEWLQYGIGDRLDFSTDSTNILTTNVVESGGDPFTSELLPGSPSERDFVLIPVISIESGDPALLNEHIKIEGGQALPRTLIESLSLNSSKCVFIKSPDAGMEPYIFDGDLVLVDQSQREIIDKMVYAFIGQDSRVSLRRISIQLSGQVVLRSDNSDKIRFPDENVSKSEIESIPIFGRVRWRMGGGGL